MSPDPLDKVRELVASLESFADNMKAQDIHVGIGTGSDARCVTCGKVWPCPGSRTGPDR